MMLASSTDTKNPIGRAGTYFASWSGDPAKPEAYRQLREQHGYLITSTWIDRFGSKDADHGADMWVMSEQWQRMEKEIAQSERLIIDLAGEQLSASGVFIEVHMAASAGVDVYIVLNGIEINPVKYPVMERWLERPLVKFVPDMASALAGADRINQPTALPGF
jgi:hypothetical protein